MSYRDMIVEFECPECEKPFKFKLPKAVEVKIIRCKNHECGKDIFIEGIGRERKLRDIVDKELEM